MRLHNLLRSFHLAGFLQTWLYGKRHRARRWLVTDAVAWRKKISALTCAARNGAAEASSCGLHAAKTTHQHRQWCFMVREDCLSNV